MKLSRYMREDVIKLEMTTVLEPHDECNSIERWRQRSKELIINELVDLLESGYRIGNKSKLVIDFINREKKPNGGNPLDKGASGPPPIYQSEDSENLASPSP